MQKVETAEQFNQILQSGQPFTFLKHSVTCPISQAAYEEYVKFTEDHPALNSYYLTVQDSRPLSNYIAEKFQIKHESPQAFYISNQQVVWHASHWKITSDALEKAKEANK
ncbi:bacillithiol system redox-active protein YtxJ [Bacillus marasmi]|uniref:bacillithiol system redox-active protein YtxJ n=1 Tax=Bacillus marasmi TaxID=1926279 RepID=UPI001FE60F09|nr:bacillithiol system redox-active protein YtxJ [Bacillus marasmi]